MVLYEYSDLMELIMIGFLKPVPTELQLYPHLVELF